MSRYELSIATNYVPNWTVVDAVRELFQNAIDQETTLPDNKMFFNYTTDLVPGTYELDATPDTVPGSLRIGNKSSILQAKSLLLGGTTKANDPNTIGQFGEGYKIACLVLLREGKQVTFYNYGAREVWIPKFVQSRKYGEKILVFDVDKKFIWYTVPNNNLTIEIEGITVEEYKQIVESNLHLQGDIDAWETPKGRILPADDFAHKVYVNGLYVCDHEPYAYGYDFKPQYLKLGRDRKLVNTFDLEWLSSEMWASTDDIEVIDTAAKLARIGAADVKFVTNHRYTQPTRLQKIATATHRVFKQEHGDKAVPVSTQEEMKRIPKGYEPIITSQQEKQLIESSSEYTPVELEKEETLKERLERWLQDHGRHLRIEAKSQMEEIIDSIQ